MSVLLLLILLCLFFLILTSLWSGRRRSSPPVLHRFKENPILEPIPEHWWESQAVFNPAAVYEGGRVHLFYRALGNDGISRIGYASSRDGIHFDERLPYPIYDWGKGFTPPSHSKYRPLSYNTDLYASGGGWGGCEDPRAVTIGDTLYLTFDIFQGWQSIQLGITSLPLEHLKDKIWQWAPHILMSPPNETNKNWVLFPEKIGGRFAILHALTPSILVEYVDALEDLKAKPIKSNNHRGGRAGAWDAFVRGAAAPPIKTEEGWLLLYHGMDPAHADVGYKLGAMLLDLKDPTKILYRSSQPILEPNEWYENDWKPGVIYGSGAVILGDNLIVYYGGGDKRVAAAQINLKEFLHKLTNQQNVSLTAVSG